MKQDSGKLSLGHLRGIIRPCYQKQGLCGATCTNYRNTTCMSGFAALKASCSLTCKLFNKFPPNQHVFFNT